MSEFLDEQYVRRYLMARNYSQTLAALDIESENDNLKSCPSKIVNAMNRAITGVDYDALGKLWKGLEDCFSTRLDQSQSDRFFLLKAYTFKTLLCEATKSGRSTVINNFFSTQTLFDPTAADWVVWLAIPFIKEPNKHELFGRYFTKTWLEILKLSLTNFFCVIFSSLPNYSTASMDNRDRQKAGAGSVQPTVGFLDDFDDLVADRALKPQ